MMGSSSQDPHLGSLKQSRKTLRDIPCSILGGRRKSLFPFAGCSITLPVKDENVPLTMNTVIIACARVTLPSIAPILVIQVVNQTTH
jgi:hypothetical protein